MKRIATLALGLHFGMAAIAPTQAADNLAAVQADTAKTPFKYRAFDLGSGVFLPAHALLDPTGAAFGVPGNPFFVTMTNLGTLATDTKLEAVRALLAAPLTINLPTNAATAAAQATGNTSLAAIATANGAPADAAWDGAAASASQTGILKSLWNKLGSLLTVDTVVRGNGVDVGGTITAGGTAQTFTGANLSRRSVSFQNHSSGDLYFVCNGTNATLDYHSLRIPAGTFFDTPPHHVGTGACSVIGATTGQAFYARVN